MLAPTTAVSVRGGVTDYDVLSDAPRMTETCGKSLRTGCVAPESLLRCCQSETRSVAAPVRLNSFSYSGLVGFVLLRTVVKPVNPH